jgi:hypothetical protein
MALCDNRAAMMIVGGGPLPQLRRDAFLNTRRFHQSASPLSHTHLGNLQHRNAMALYDNPAAMMIVGGGPLPQLRRDAFLNTRRFAVRAHTF